MKILVHLHLYKSYWSNHLKLVKILIIFIRNCKKRKILLVSHELTNTGAPIALLGLAKILREMDYFVVVYSPLRGPLSSEFKKNDIPVIILRKLFFRISASALKSFCLIVCNTVVAYKYVKILDKKNINYMWWLHEAAYFESFFQKRPESLNVIRSAKNIYTVSKFSRSFISKYNDNVKILNFGITDDSFKYNSGVEKYDKTVFILPASIIPVKGQDILIKAFGDLEEKYCKKIEVVFCGSKGNDLKYYNDFVNKISKYEYMKYLGELSHDETLKLISESNVLVLPSRGDSYSIITIEALMLDKPVLISNRTGVAEYITNGVNGVIFDVDKIDELTNCIRKFIDNPNIIKSSESRKLYLNVFGIDKYKNRIKSLLKENNIIV